MKNYEVFENFLLEDDFHMEKIKSADDESIFFRTQQTSDNGANVTLVSSFYENSNIIDIHVYNLTKLNSPLKEEKFLYLLNDLNSTSRFSKFTLTDNKDIHLSYSYFSDEHFTEQSAQHLFDNMLMMYHAAVDAYPKLMRLQWS